MEISNFKDIYNNLQNKFPVKECTVRTLQQGVYDGKKYYLCLIVDKRFKDEIQMKVLKPYVWIGNKSSDPDYFKDQIGWGWTTDDGNYYVDNFENPIHEENEVVIGFILYKDKDNGDSELWDLINREDD
jgi:hypothetical protein